MKISILIPVNNYDIVALVNSIKNGMEKVPEFCEILIGDDGSTEAYRKKYLSLSGDNVRVTVSEKNIGRAAIRNKLVTEAKGDYLLFIDADAMIPATADIYMRKYLQYIKLSRVISGGILYMKSPPGDPNKMLRWKYGYYREAKKARERNKNPYATFSTFNVLFDKSVFSKLKFYEELKQYGHEDTLLSYQMEKAGIEIIHIDNGLIHEGLETNNEFLAKTKLGIENLSLLYDKVTDRKTFTSVATILQAYEKLRFFKFNRILASLFIRFREKMEIKSSIQPVYL